ncbi:MAG: hypothetical protein NT011_04725 [Kiritimatiellaeota bacterium]|nr:hypothetical protein [Kiritimatiellota bacterium]
MQLNDTQKDAVKKWIAEGCGLTEIQKRLNDEFKLSVTFLDLRFLILDLGLTIKEQTKNTSAGLDLAKAAPGRPEVETTNTEPEPLGPDSAGGVAVTLDRIVKPGSVVSGTVRFSDGVSATWMLDQLGRLAIDAGKPNYRPSPEDVQAFQMELRNLLQSRGI